ncbi:MAG TPA: tetratricopeptide repeat protein [Blastocatellia bacterium]
MRKNIMVVSLMAVLALMLSPVGSAFAQSTMDRRAEAGRKYLEGKRLEETGNYSGAVAAYKQAIELDPQAAELRITLGSLYLKNRNIIDAEAQAREAVKIAPEDLGVRKLLAQVYLVQATTGTAPDKEKARAAINELEEIIKRDPQSKLQMDEAEVPALAVIADLYWTLEEQDKAIEALKKVSEGNAAMDEIHFQLARFYFHKKKYRDAATAARRAYDISQKANDARKSNAYAGLLAKSLLYIGRSQEAIDIYEKALGIKKTASGAPVAKEGEELFREVITDPQLMFDYAEALVFAGRYDDASKLLDPLIKGVRKETPLYLTAIRIKVDSLRRSGKREDAVRTLEEALKGQDVSESLPILYSLAETYEEMEQFDKAISTYEEALSSILNPDGTVNAREWDKNAASIMLQRIGNAHRLAGRREKAVETFERMRKVLGVDSPRADQLILDTLMNEGKYKEAMAAATTAAERFADERSFKFYRAQAAAKLGDLDTSNKIFASLVEKGGQDADVYLFWAGVQLESNQLKEAELTVRKAIDLEPNDLGPLVTLSSIQERQKKYKESEATLRKALEIDPDNATVLNNLGYFLADRNERLAEAESLIRRAVNIEPTNGSFLDSLGWLLYRQGKTEEARKYLEQAVVYSPRSATIHDHLGDLYKKQGQVEKARVKWEEALKLSNDPEEIKKIKEKLGKK